MRTAICKTDLPLDQDYYDVNFWSFKNIPEPLVYPFCAEESKRVTPRKIDMTIQPFLVIAFLRSGSLCYLFRDRKITMNEGDILLVPPLVQYSFESFSTGGKYHKLVIEFKGVLLNEYLTRLGLNKVIHWSKSDAENFMNTFYNIAAMNQRCRNDEIPEIAAATVRLLHQFSLHVRQKKEIRFSQILTNACKAIENNLDIPVDLKIIQEKLAISHSTLGRLFRSSLGISPREYWIGRKIETAEYLLLHTDFSIKEIAFRLGYSSQFHFSNEFRRLKTISPTQFRKYNVL